MEAQWRIGDDVGYAYAVGRIRALETRLLTRERGNRMAEAGNIELLTYWQVLQAADPPLAIFVHLLDAHSIVVGQLRRPERPADELGAGRRFHPMAQPVGRAHRTGGGVSGGVGLLLAGHHATAAHLSGRRGPGRPPAPVVHSSQVRCNALR